MLLILLFPLIAVVFLTLILLPKQHKKIEEFRPPPGPKGLPIIGNLHQFDPSKPAHLYFAKLAKIYGPIFSLRLGHRSMVVIQSAKMAKEVLQTQDKNFINRFSSVGARRLSYNGLDLLFAPYNDYYTEIKKFLVVHFLSSEKVQSFAPIRQKEISRLIQKISTSNVVNLSELIVNYATSNICNIAFGKRYVHTYIRTSICLFRPHKTTRLLRRIVNKVEQG